MTTRKNPATSHEAYRSLSEERLNETYLKILSALAHLGQGTFEDIAAYLKVDKASVWKRLSELERLQKIYKPGAKKKLRSGRNGYVWMLCGSVVPKTDKELRRISEAPNQASDKRDCLQVELF